MKLGSFGSVLGSPEQLHPNLSEEISNSMVTVGSFINYYFTITLGSVLYIYHLFFKDHKLLYKENHAAHLHPS